MKHKILSIIGICALAGMVFSLIFSNRGLNKRLQMMEGQIQRSSDIMAALESNQSLLKESSGRVRSYLNLPALPFNDGETGEEGRSRTSTFELAAYDALAYLTEYNGEQDDLRLYASLLEDKAFNDQLDFLGLRYRRISGFSGSLEKGGDVYFRIKSTPGEETFQFTASVTGAEFEGSPLSQEIRERISAETADSDALIVRGESMNKALRQLLWDRSLRSVFRDLDLSLVDGGIAGGNLSLSLLRIDRSRQASIRSDRKSASYLLGDKSFNDIASLKKGLLTYLEESDLRTDAQVRDDLVKEEMLALLKEPAFVQRLKDLGYSADLSSREDNDYIYYDLLNDEGERAGALALQKDFAEVYLMDGEDIPVRSLRSFTPTHELTYAFEDAGEDVSDELPVIPDMEGSENFLLIGSHEHNADTMILVHSDGSSRDIRMLSIPRDLYYEGRKINSIFRQYGPEKLISVLSSLTGLSIDNYVAVDMYAFIDVVNILGGIDVTLDESLVDPTYKVRVNGKWSTLFYPAGTHHLDGIAALRIARSRHTSSDFERSVRQQKVIAALKDRAAEMSLADMDKIYDIVQVAGKYLQTNMNTAEMVKYLLSFRDYSISGQHVMNTDNILYATYTNLYRLSAEEQEKALEDPDFYKGGWIVLPKGNDWSIIKSYIRNIF